MVGVKRRTKTPSGTVPHVEPTRNSQTAITNGTLFAKPRTAAIQSALSAMYTPQSGSATLQMFLAIQQQTKLAQDQAQRVYSQEISNKQMLDIERNKLIAQAKRNPAQAAELDQKIQQLPDNTPWQAMPPPSDLWAAMRAAEPMLRANGDVWQTILIPAQVMFNSQRPIRINCEDEGALRQWKTFFDNETGKVPIDKWGLDCYLTVEQFGQWFPLEYWKDNDLQGIATLEPTSLWIGHHLGMGYPPMSIITPESFSEAKWRDMCHDAAFTTFVNDQNIQTFPAFRIPLKPDVLSPVYGYGKKGFERYVFPHLARAYDQMMYRMMLFEYRQGILESWIAQVLMLVVKGWGNNPPSKGAVTAIQQMLDNAISSHKGDLVIGYDVEPHMLKPDALDAVMGVETWIESTQTIFRSLGFDIFLASGEIAGTHGRGGGVQVEVSVQVAMERWKSHLVNYFHWCTHIARKFAEKNDKTLLKSLPSFQIAPSSYETQLQIERAIKPLFAAGILSPQTALERADENYATEIANLRKHEPNKELMQPPATFAQTSFGQGGEQTTRQQNPGRPRGTDEDEPRKPKARESIQVWSSRQEHDDLKAAIVTMFSAMSMRPTRDSVIGFASELESALRAQMGTAYAEGYRTQGGFGDLDMTLLAGAVAFQIEHLQNFKHDLLSMLKQPERLGAQKHRAQQYAGALVTAYVLGTQQAARMNGARGWQRILHPELSKSGPCADCIADSAKLHDISEAWFDFHPSEKCSMQSVLYSFGDASPLTVQVPSVILPGHRVRRLPYGGLG